MARTMRTARMTAGPTSPKWDSAHRTPSPVKDSVPETPTPTSTTTSASASRAGTGAAAKLGRFTPRTTAAPSNDQSTTSGANSARSARSTATSSRASTRTRTTPATSVSADEAELEDALGSKAAAQGIDDDGDELDFLTPPSSMPLRTASTRAKRKLPVSAEELDQEEAAAPSSSGLPLRATLPASKQADESSSKRPRRSARATSSTGGGFLVEDSIVIDSGSDEEEADEDDDDDEPMIISSHTIKKASDARPAPKSVVKSSVRGGRAQLASRRKAATYDEDEELSDAEPEPKEEDEDSDDPLAELNRRIGASSKRASAVAAAPIKQDKGKGKAKEPAPRRSARARTSASSSTFKIVDDEDEEDDEDAEDAGEQDVDSDDGSEFLAGSEVDDLLAEQAKAVAGGSRAGGGFIVEIGDDDDEEEEGEEESELSDEDGGKGKKGFAKGSMQEDQKYETAKQKAARLKSEAYKKRLKKKKNKPSHYQATREMLNKHHPELKDIWDTLKNQPPKQPVAAPQPDGLTIKLLPFQREGVDWLVKQEKSQWAGGLLADEMGMGKTIQMIGLMLSDHKEKKGPALVVAPTVAIMQWRNEIAKYTNGFKVLVWHGIKRDSDVKALKKFDVILTSYQTLERTFSKQEKGMKRKGELIFEESPLHAIHWHRIVLDEAHNIKERSTNVAKAAFELEGDYRWCLSGTPLQNRVGELYSMIRFLGGDPYAFYYCKRCPCKSLHWMFSDRRHCDACGHTPMHHTCFWNNEILKPIQRFGIEGGEGGDAFGRLRILLERLMLRRTKLERADDMGLPPRTVEVRYDMFNEEEEDLYESLYKDTTRKFSTYLDQGTVLNNYSNIFTLLTRMRQMANHPDLVLRSQTGMAQNLLADGSGVENRICKICLEVSEDPIMSRCRHVFCRECIRQYLDTDLEVAGATHDCPYCHATLTIDLEQEALEAPIGHDAAKQGIISRLDMSKWRSSTKIEALVEELTNLRAEDKTIKSIVFSQFVNFLDLIAFRLQRAGFSICRLEGNMTPEARDKTIRHFMENPGVTVFLVSLKAGGVALNLTEASRVFLMDPWWNPSVEVQAMDRIHRLGQHRPIVVKRMVIANSLEERIIELQNKKAAMIDAAIGKDETAAGRLSVQDLRFLFTM